MFTNVIHRGHVIEIELTGWVFSYDKVTDRLTVTAGNASLAIPIQVLGELLGTLETFRYGVPPEEQALVELRATDESPDFARTPEMEPDHKPDVGRQKKKVVKR